MKPEDNTAPIGDEAADTSVDTGVDESTDDSNDTDDWDDAFDDLYEKEDTGASNDDDDSKEDTESEGDDANDNPEKTSGNEDVVGKTDAKEEAQDPAREQKEIVKQALSEMYSEQQEVSARTQELTSEAISLIYPEGIKDPRVDSDGDKLNGPEDVEKLYNPNTGELFTPEEARSWWNQASKQYEQNVREATQQAAHVADVSMRLEKGREAVMRNYGEFIKDNPEIAQKVLARYMSTVKVAGEGDNQYIADAPIDILEFYNDVMYPYVELDEKKKEAEAAAEEARKIKEAALKRGKAQRDESRDLPTTVSDDATKTGDEDDWDTAFKQYYGGK